MIHLEVGGSTASRTLACSGWIDASKDIPSRPAGQAAIDGSMHHEVQEMCQKTETHPEDHLGFVYKENGLERVFDGEDLILSDIAYNATNALLDELDIDQLEIEPFLQYVEGKVGGSTDLLGLSDDGKTLLSLDYKFGRNRVTAENNSQLLFYPMCARRDKKTADMFAKVEKLVLVIIQPQVKGVVDTWECTIKDLDAFELAFNKALDKVYLPNPPRTPGSHCNWCPAAPFCEAKRQSVHQATLLGARSHNELSAAAAMVQEVEQWVKDVHEELYLQLNRGVKVDGWKIVDKQAKRAWVDEKKARDYLVKNKVDESAFTKTVMLTAPQTLAALKKAKIDFSLDDFIEQKSSGTTLAPESDSRDAVIVTDTVGHLAEMMKK
jgi:hypothetical protein